jgi:hypothetical protein
MITTETSVKISESLKRIFFSGDVGWMNGKGALPEKAPLILK